MSIHPVGDAIQPSHLLSSPSPPAFNLSQHQGLFQWVSSSHQVARVLEFQLQQQSFQWTFRTDLETHSGNWLAHFHWQRALQSPAHRGQFLSTVNVLSLKSEPQVAWIYSPLGHRFYEPFISFLCHMPTADINPSHGLDICSQPINCQLLSLGSKITADVDCTHEIKKCLFLGRKSMTNLDATLKGSHFSNKGPYNQSYGFSSRHMWMWELDHKEGWVSKIWCFWAVVLEKILESPLSRKIKPVNLKGNQLWILIRRTDAEAPILWPPDAKNWPTGKDPDAGKDRRREEKGATEDEMVGWDHWLEGHDFEQTWGDSGGQGSLLCCSPWGRKDSGTT